MVLTQESRHNDMLYQHTPLCRALSNDVRLFCMGSILPYCLEHFRVTQVI